MSATPAEIGARVRSVRRLRAMDLDVAAGLAGISRSYLAMLERGERHFNTRGLIENLANALTCAVADLTGQPYEPADKPSAKAMSAIPQIGLALIECTLDDVPDVRSRPVPELAAAARLANEHRQEVRHDLAGQGLGQLLTEQHVVAVTGSGADQEVALAALVEACFVADVVAQDLGHTALAVQAAERGLDAARRLGDPALIGFAGMHLGLKLMNAGSRHRATSVLTEVIDNLAMVDPTATDTLAAEAYGFAHLSRALLAARSGQADTAAEHLAEATRIARRTGERNSLTMNFGPTNIEVWRISIGVELQQAGTVYEQAQAANIDTAVLSKSRVGGMHLGLARSGAQVGGRRDLDAAQHLDLADQHASQRIRHDPVALELLAELDQPAPQKTWLLESLKRRFGLVRG